MESARTYITSELAIAANKCKDIKFEYKFDEFSLEHLIKITPKELFVSDHCIDIQESIATEFIEKYPYESIVFFTEGDWIDIGDPDETFTFWSCPSFNNFDTYSPNFICAEELSSFGSIEEDDINLMGLTAIRSRLEDCTGFDLTCIVEHFAEFYDLTHDKKCLVLLKSQESLHKKPQKSDSCEETQCKCFNYALAA